MWFLRRMLRISYLEREVLERAGTARSLLKEARKRQAVFFGHVMRRKELEHLVTTGKIDGKRSRGRQREKILDSMTVWLQKDKPIQTILWRSRGKVNITKQPTYYIQKNIYIDSTTIQ